MKLNKHQEEFVDAKEQYVGLFGGVGNGKTLAASLKIIELATQSPQNLCLVGRLTYPELRDSTREVFLRALSQIYQPEAYTINKSENSVTFWNDSTIIFRHLDDKATLLGPNLGAFYIDQAEEVDEEAFLTLQSRLRRPEAKYLKGLVTGNPRGYNWVYYKFGMDKSEGATNWLHNQDYRMVTAPTIANLANLPANYVTQLKNSYSPEWFNRYVMGSWDAFEGQIFDLTKVSGYDVLPEIRMVLTACDPAISKSKTACNTAFVTLGVGVNGHIYDLETIAGQWSFLEQLEQAEGIVKRHKPSHIGVEDVAYQRALYEACERYFRGIQVHDLKADKDKYRRAKSVSHIISKGLFHTNNKELMGEISAFNPEAEGKERKDRVDALVHCLHMVQMYAPLRFEVEDNKYKAMSAGQYFLTKSKEQEFEALKPQGNIIFNQSDGPVDPNYY